MSTNISRCPWSTDELYHAYHDREWGVPVHDDRVLFEFLILEGALRLAAEDPGKGMIFRNHHLSAWRIPGSLMSKPCSFVGLC